MINIEYNVSSLDKEVEKLKALGAGQPEGSKMLREIATTLCGEMHRRIHVQGKKSDGSQIGTYSPEYMKLRTGQYSTNRKITKGKNKGQADFKGTYTKGKNKGKPRYQYNKTNDTKVIFDLSGYMANDFLIGERNPIDLKEQGIGLGFTEPAKPEPGETKAISNNEKRLHLEKRYGKVYDLTKEEQEMVRAIADKYITNLLK